MTSTARQVPQARSSPRPRPDRRHRPDPQGHQDRRSGLLPAGRPGRRRQVVRRAGDRRRRRFLSTACRSHRQPGHGTAASEAGLPIIGDDISPRSARDHRPPPAARLLPRARRRCSTPRSLNVGGNMDFFNMLERERPTRRRSEDQRRHLIKGTESRTDVHVGPRTTPCRG